MLLAQKLEDMRPRVVAFNGKMVYKSLRAAPASSAFKRNCFTAARLFVLPSTSGQNGGTSGGVKKRYFKQLAALLKALKD